MSEANGQPLSPQDTRKPRGNYTGERLSVRKAQGIINALAYGEPVERIARQLHTSKHTVMSVRERECWKFGGTARENAKGRHPSSVAGDGSAIPAIRLSSSNASTTAAPSRAVVGGAGPPRKYSTKVRNSVRSADSPEKGIFTVAHCQ